VDFIQFVIGMPTLENYKNNAGVGTVNWEDAET
jgi:hypothetical protein